MPEAISTRAALAKARRLAQRADMDAVTTGAGAALSPSVLWFSYHRDADEMDAAALRSDWTVVATDLWTCLYRFSEEAHDQERLFDPEDLDSG